MTCLPVNLPSDILQWGFIGVAAFSGGYLPSHIKEINADTDLPAIFFHRLSTRSRYVSAMATEAGLRPLEW